MVSPAVAGLDFGSRLALLSFITAGLFSRTGDALFESASVTANLSVMIGQQVSLPTAASRPKRATVRNCNEKGGWW